MAMQALGELYAKKNEKDIFTIALGDSPNDLEMLHKADLSIVVKNKDGQHLKGLDHAHAVYTDGIGPAGWRQAIEALLKSIKEHA